ncbi:38269_t:CDS:2 [Gigaspora margarita]|uniref:urease n=1 Tax=Gigaspora margarita TaxID=4874 RepID=A0ABM8VYR6_GIGMA|nr:38269_t:CDS:2 [Gigaspora margarita]
MLRNIPDTINQEIANGISHLVGSIEKGKAANLVMYSQAFFDTKPEIVIKSGIIVWSQMGDANASIPTTQLVISRPMFVAYEEGSDRKELLNIGKEDMKLNASLPKIEVDPETYVV